MRVLNPGPDNPQSEVTRDVLHCAVLIQLYILKQRYVHFFFATSREISELERNNVLILLGKTHFRLYMISFIIMGWS